MTESKFGMDTPWYLITGACGGIGAEITRKLLGMNLRVVGVDVKPSLIRSELLESVTVKIPNDGFDWLDKLLNSHSEPPSGVICAQGVYKRYPLEAYDAEKFDEVFESNFLGIFWTLRKIVPFMANRSGGNIVVISSQAGVTGGADPLYASSKAACNALVKSIAREYSGRKIAINTVSPGPVNTNMAKEAMSEGLISDYKKKIPIGRFTEASEIASLVTYLITSSSPALTGSAIDIDGGLVRR
jgi:NAD(P)-dependent dehydrogenase (short-subunit alcohol dehydrogenase family)